MGLLKEDEMNAVADVFGAIFLCFELLLAFSNTTVALPKPTEVVGTVGGTQGAASHGRRSRKARSTSGFASRNILLLVVVRDLTRCVFAKRSSSTKRDLVH